MSSDAYTLFGRDSARVHNREVRDATHVLLHRTITTFAAQLQIKGATQPITSTELVNKMHQAGINCR